MAITLADAVVFLRGDDTELNKSLGGAETKVGGFVGNATKLLGGALLGGITVAAGAVAGIGAAAFSASADFDEAVDAIITKTGASGDALDAMGESVKNIKASTAGLGFEFETIGAVMGEVNSRTGATGQGLESLTSQILEFSRVTGTDATTNVGLLTRTMGDWSVSNENAGALLDQIFGASQAFGIGVEDLSAKLVTFGAPLRQMGFSLEESIALFGKWEEEGVNAELAIGSLRIAAGGFAKEGIDLATGLADVQARIKGAATESEALNIAMETFGARAGPDMAAAIREGRFELDSAIEALQGTQGGLAEAAEGTLDFRDKWEVEMAKVRNAMIPLGDKLFDLGERLFPLVSGAIEFLMPILTDLIDGLVDLIDQFTGAKESGEELSGFFGGISTVTKAVTDGFGQVVNFVRDNFIPSLTQTGGTFDLVRQRVDEIMPYIQTIITTVLGAIQSFWEAHGATIMEVVRNTFDTISTVITTVLDVILQAVKLVLQLITGDFEGAGETLQEIVKTIWNGVKRVFENQLDSIKKIVGAFDLAAAGRAIIASLRKGIEEKWEGLKSWFSDKLKSLRDMLPFSEPKDPTSPLRNLSKAGQGITEQIQKGLNDLDSGFLRPVADAAAGVGGGSVAIQVTQNFYGPADEAGVRRGAERGLLDALRQIGRR